jgi:membrane-bound lytic murein transglycosylase B
VDFDPASAPADTPVLLVPAEQEAGPAYRVGFKNFEVITRYNRSVRYAMAVHDLATTIAGRAKDIQDAETKLAAQPSGTAAR